MLNLLTVIFITLKLIGVIAWSWWLVLSPTLFVVSLYLIYLILAVIAGAVDKPSLSRGRPRIY